MSKRDNLRKSYIFYDYYSRLKSIALSVYVWEGLPNTCNARFLEDTLFHYGQAVFVKDSLTGYLNLKVTQADMLNVYNEPLAFLAFSTGYSKVYDKDDCVFIRNNYINKSTDSTIVLYAERLARIQMAMDVNINAQKTPILVRCDEKTKKTLETVYDMYAGDKPVIFGTKSLQEKPLESITTGAPYVVDKLREEKSAVWDEALEFLGVNTNPSDKKKERLIVSEVESNNEEIGIQSETMLLCRQEACDRINKMYGLNVSVRRRLEDDSVVKGGEDDAELHD